MTASLTLPGDALSQAYLTYVTPTKFDVITYLQCVARELNFSMAELQEVLDTSEGRRMFTKTRLLLFIIVYAPELLMMKTGEHTDQITMNEMSLDFVRHGLEWLEPPIAAKVCRHLFACPRNGGKSSWVLGALPLYLACHGRQKEFVVGG